MVHVATARSLMYSQQAGTQAAVLYEKERRTHGRTGRRARENLVAIKYYFAFSSSRSAAVLAEDAEEANKVIIIAPISESDTLLFAVSH